MGLVPSDRLLHRVDDHTVLALRIASLPDSSDVAAKVGTIRRFVGVSPDYLEPRGCPQSPGDLAEHDFVAFSAFAQSVARSFGKGAAAGPCLAVLEGRLIPVLDAFSPEPVPVSLVYSGQRLLPRKLRAFLDFTAPRLKAGLQGRESP